MFVFICRLLYLRVGFLDIFEVIIIESFLYYYLWLVWVFKDFVFRGLYMNVYLYKDY